VDLNSPVGALHDLSKSHSDGLLDSPLEFMIAGVGTGVAAGRGIESATVRIGGLELEKSL